MALHTALKSFKISQNSWQTITRSFSSMRGKPYTSREKEIISNVYSYFKANNPLENKAYLIRKTAEATKSSFSSVRRISIESDDGKGHKSSRKKPNRKDAFDKLDDFDQEAVRRAIHWF